MAARIPVVDDEPMVRALIARVLTDEGYEVIAVANGRAALDAARGADKPFSVAALREAVRKLLPDP
jgi:CheY-like chemotaxis protein